MDFVLAFSLILAILSTGQSYTESTEKNSKSCFELCPPGYHKVGDCNDRVAKHRCKKCDGPTYTDIYNSILKCLRCDTCGKNEEEKKACSFNSNVVCDCRKGFYNAGSENFSRHCLACPHEYCKDDKEGCRFDRCLNHPECRRICIPSTTTETNAVATNSTLNPAVVPIKAVSYSVWMFLILVAVLSCLLLLFIRNLLRYSDSCLCDDMNKDLTPSAEDPEFNEHHSHQGCSPTTLTFTISEETPMMTLSQIPEHPALTNLLAPDTENTAARQKEQSEHWPAIVLYAIIKEVPLRRWKEFLRLLSVADQQLELVELEAGLGLGFTERQYQMLRLWSQRSSARLSDVFSALHYMDLSGCAQLLQESLERLQWQPEPM